jgi:hypothetical protein
MPCDCEICAWQPTSPRRRLGACTYSAAAAPEAAPPKPLRRLSSDERPRPPLRATEPPAPAGLSLRDLILPGVTLALLLVVVVLLLTEDVRGGAVVPAAYYPHYRVPLAPACACAPRARACSCAAQTAARFY